MMRLVGSFTIIFGAIINAQKIFDVFDFSIFGLPSAQKWNIPLSALQLENP